MKTAQKRISRRAFLLAATAGTAATGAALVAPNKKTNGGAADGSSSEAQQGYRLSEHVRNYYRTAKI